MKKLDVSDLKKGGIYKMNARKDEKIFIVKLHEIQTYPSSGMPADYIFDIQSGLDDFPVDANHRMMWPDVKRAMPLPEGLLSYFEIYSTVEEDSNISDAITSIDDYIKRKVETYVESDASEARHLFNRMVDIYRYNEKKTDQEILEILMTEYPL